MTVEDNQQVQHQQPMENAPGAIAGMVCGIVSIVLCCIPVVAQVLGTIGIVLYVKVKKTIEESEEPLGGKGMAIAGLACGITGIAFGLFWILYYILIGAVVYNQRSLF